MKIATISVVFVGAFVVAESTSTRASCSLGSGTSSAPVPPSPLPSPQYVNPDSIGTFNMSQLNATDFANSAILTRQEEELLTNRTTQVRHGSALRHISRGEPLEGFSAQVNGSVETIDSFMHKFGIAGLAVVQDGATRVEEYRYGNLPASRNVIQSCTKSFITTSIGIAVAEGKVSVDDLVSAHVPELAGTPYGDVPLQNLMDMTSGVVEPPVGNSPDLFDVLYPSTDSEAVLNAFKSYVKVAEPGKVFNYYNPNYYVLSVCLARATKEPVQSYVTRSIWEPAGMQYDGYMRTTGAGQVDGHGGLAISLLDMARFGLSVLDTLSGRGGFAVPAGWYEDVANASTSTGVRAPGAIPIAPGFGYQSGWWTLPRGGEKYALGDDSAFAALGTFDQAIYVIPGLNATVGLQSSYPIHTDELFYYGQELVTAIALALKE